MAKEITNETYSHGFHAGNLRRRVAGNAESFELLENESIILQSLNGGIPHSFRTPRMHGSSRKNNKLIREFVEGTPLGTKKNLHPDFTNYIGPIAQCILNMRMPVVALPHDAFKKSNLSWSQAISTPETLPFVWKKLRAPAYARDVKGVQTHDLLKVINQSDISRQSFNHCEVSPWHIILDTKGKLNLIGFDWASNKFPEHYDVAHAAARLGVSYARPDLAKKLLANYRDCIKESDKSQLPYFYNTIDGLVAVRTLGELRDVCLDVRKDGIDDGNISDALQMSKYELKEAERAYDSYAINHRGKKLAADLVAKMTAQKSKLETALQFAYDAGNGLEF